MTVRRWLERQDEPEDAVEQTVEDRPLAAHVRRYTDADEGPQEQVEEPSQSMTNEGAPAQGSNLASVGEHVASVLAAAEAAAAKLRRDAEEETRQSRAIAEEEARTLRAEAESYATRRKEEADAESAHIVGDAEQRASELERVAAERHRRLLSDISASEERMTDLAASLHEVATRLEQVAGARIQLAEYDADAPVRRAGAEGVAQTEPVT